MSLMFYFKLMICQCSTGLLSHDKCSLSKCFLCLYMHIYLSLYIRLCISEYNMCVYFLMLD